MTSEIRYEIDAEGRQVVFVNWPNRDDIDGEGKWMYASFDCFFGGAWAINNDPANWLESDRRDDKLTALRVARDELIDRSLIEG